MHEDDVTGGQYTFMKERGILPPSHYCQLKPQYKQMKQLSVTILISPLVNFVEEGGGASPSPFSPPHFSCFRHPSPYLTSLCDEIIKCCKQSGMQTGEGRRGQEER